MEDIKIQFLNYNREFLLERKKIIEELLQENLEELDFNEANLLKAKNMAKKYDKLIFSDLHHRPINIIIANSDNAELASIYYKQIIPDNYSTKKF